MLPEQSANVFTFPEGTSAENVVKTVLVMLQAHHEREAERLNEILTGVPTLYTQKLARTWERLRMESENDEEALSLLTQVVIAELDGGTAPDS